MQNSAIKVILEGRNVERIFEGLLTTIEIAFVSVILGTIIGIFIGLSRTSKNKIVLFINRIYLEAFRIIPTLVWLFIFYFGVTTALNIDLSGEVVSIIVFTLWGAAEMGDLVRGALQSLPKHQIESGLAIGLNKAQLYRYITKKAPIKSEDELKGKKIIVAKGTTAETYMTKNKPDVQLVKYEQYSEIFQALKDGRGDGILSDNTEVIAWVKDNPSFTVGISNLGSQDTIAPAVAKGNKELKNWINDELKALGKEKFVHEAYDKTLQSVYGKEFEENLVIEGGELK